MADSVVAPGAAAATWTSVAEFYETARSVAAIAQTQAKRVALQFPDKFLGDAIAVKEQLQAAVGPSVRFFILGDTSYGSVHVDEVNAQHISADLIIHYGAAHVTATNRIPVQWVLNKVRCPEPEGVVRLLKEQLEALTTTSRPEEALPALPPAAQQSYLIVAFESPFLHLRSAVHAALGADPRVCLGSSPLDEHGFFQGTSPLFAAASAASATHKEKIAPQAASGVAGSDVQLQTPATTNVPAVCGSYFGHGSSNSIAVASLNLERNVLVYIGQASRYSDSLYLRFGQCQHRHIDPSASPLCISKPPGTATHKLMLKRFYVVEELRKASTVGIVVGTLAIARYTEVLQHVKSMLEGCGKKPYVFVVGKINVAKLSNFGDIDAFVLVGGIDHDLLGNRDYPKIIATPFEAECAFGNREWTGEYIVDFGELLGDQDNARRPGKPSTISEGMAGSRSVDADAKALLAPNVRTGTHLIALQSPAAIMLQQKEYRGLEIDRENNVVELATQGQFGIARGYESEQARQEIASSNDSIVGSTVTNRTLPVHVPGQAQISAPEQSTTLAAHCNDPELSISGTALFDDEMSDISSFDDDEDTD
eukprot:INCI19797.1.p1 GENE.INCI19797.1~~INCI19797.1.p1  ORF type:complete len:594 (+),score=108.00 INCI19797.1:184-1965(+)